MLVDIGIVLAILAPVIAIVALHGSRYRPDPRWSVALTAFLCVLTAFMAALASAALMVFAQAADDVIARAGTTWRLLPALALFEELSRFVVLAGYALRRRVPRTSRDGIVLGLAAGLAFALLENVMTFVRIGADGGLVLGSDSSASGWLRVAMATPVHALLGGLMGFLLVRAQGFAAGRFWRLGEALLLPAAVHVVYDAPVILAVAFWGEALTLEIAGLAITLSAGVDLTLAWYVWRLFSRAPDAASAARHR